MKIAYLHQHFNTPSGTVGVRSYQMARALVAQGHKVTMICGSYRGGSTGLEGPFISGRRSGIVEGIEVVEFALPYDNALSFPARALAFVKFALRSTWLTLRSDHDLVFATSTPLVAGIPGIAAALVRRKTFVFEVRDLWPELPKAMGVITNPFLIGAMSMLEWLSYRTADRCIALSPGIQQGIARRGVPQERIAMISNGCDLEIFGDAANAWRPEGIRDNQLLAVFTGTHGQANGLDAVLDAARVLVQRGRTDIAIALVGDGKLKPKLIERARAEGLDNVHFHDPVNKARLSGLMASADIGLQILANVPAFYYGTSPNKFFDYLAAGLPVLTNYPGWVADLVSEHGAGFVAPPDSPDAFADALIHAADNRQELPAMGEASARLARDRFDRNRLVARWSAWVLEGRDDEAAV